MSLYGALFTGVSGLNANSRALGISSNNIANVNTIGYKSSIAQFSTLLASSANSAGFTAGGVRAEAQQLTERQGLLQTTDSATDISISGNGFFVVTRTPEAADNNTAFLYTRSGAFTEDAQGNLRNAAGYYLMGWPLDANGELPANRNTLTPINLNTLTGTARATSELTLRANLQASEPATAGYTAGDMNAGTVTPDFERTLEVYDSQGGVQPLRLAFVKTGPNAWAYEAIYEGPAANIGGAGNNPVAAGAVTFNADGSLATPASGTAALTLPFVPAVNGLNPQNVTINFGTAGLANGLTQFDSPTTLISTGVDGALFGGLSGVSIDENGFLTALFDNGVQRRVYKLPIATFQNPNGLSSVTGNAFQRTDDSGGVTLLEAGTGGAGAIAASALEASTVDLAKEFTDLITTQRAYSAATRIITTADQMLEEMIRIKR